MSEDDKSDSMCDICGLMRDCIWDGDLWVCIDGCGDPDPGSDVAIEPPIIDPIELII
jgi:hypothetical protein